MLMGGAIMVVGNCRRLSLLLLILLLLSIICMVINQRTYLSAVSNNITVFHSAGSSSAEVGSVGTNSTSQYDDADFIVRRSFQQSYARILPCDDNPSWMKADQTNSIAKVCMEQTRDYITSENVTVPWWFQTLLRDITRRGGGVYVPWHHFYTTKPVLNFCSIDKVATTEWRSVFCKLNEADCVNNTKGTCCIKRTLQTMPKEAPWAVFIRDPLERLLSGFLDKCYNPAKLRREEHCEPNVVFNPMKGLKNDKNKTYPDLLDSIGVEAWVEGRDKLMFVAYVDVMPLKWNEHFVPQALHCDLYRNIDKYHFVGIMGRDFYFDLDRMANQFGGQLPEILNSTFGYIAHVKNENHDNTGKQNSGHAKHAAEKVARFYTARTVRKALEYLSIDYVTLGLDVPGWARQMLNNEAV